MTFTPEDWTPAKFRTSANTDFPKPSWHFAEDVDYYFSESFLKQLKTQLTITQILSENLTLERRLYQIQDELEALKKKYLTEIEILMEFKKMAFKEFHNQIFNNHVCQACKGQLE